MTTLEQIAQAADVPYGSLEALVDQLVDIDGADAVLADPDQPFGPDLTLTDEAAQTLLDAARQGSQQQAVDAVAAAAVRLSDAEDAAELARRDRDDAVRDAIAKGARVVDIADAAGMQRSRVYKIRDEA